MPKIVKTVKSTEANSNPTAIKMMAEALAGAVGTEYKRITYDDVPDHYDYLVDMTNVGYPGWAITLARMDTAANFISGVMSLNSENNLDFSNPNHLYQYVASTSTTYNTFPGSQTTCVIFMDSSKDAVLINIHPGGTETATDIVNNDQDSMTFNYFFGRDAKNNVLCGQGWGHINKIRTLTDSMTVEPGNLYPYPSASLGNSLHLTKMVNYLSPEYTEMKSAHVSVVSPAVSNSMQQNVSFYSDGGRWASVGRSNAQNMAAILRHGYNVFPPFNPWVKY